MTSGDGFLATLWRELSEDNVWNGAAALGFYLTLAVFPAMIFVMALLPYLPIAHVDQAIMDLLREALPTRTAQMFSGVVKEVVSERRGGVLTFGIAAALWASSSGMYAIMQQMNVAYDVEEHRGFLRARRLGASGAGLPAGRRARDRRKRRRSDSPRVGQHQGFGDRRRRPRHPRGGRAR